MGQRGIRITAALFAVAMLIGGIGFALGQTITSSSDVKIVAQKLEDDRIEFGLEQDGERILPRSRFFPANAEVGRWLKSSAIEVDVVELGGATMEPSPEPAPTQTITHSHCQRVRNDGDCDRRFRPIQCPTHSHTSLVGHRNDHC